MSRLHARKISGLALGAGALLVAGVAAYQSSAQQGRNEIANGAAAQVGVVALDRVFESYPGTQKFNQQAQTLQQQFAQAQQQGDQQRVMEIQNEFTQLRVKLDESFQRDLKDTAKSLAKEMDLKLIAANVVYQADDVEQVDLTPDMIAAISDDAEGE